MPMAKSLVLMTLAASLCLACGVAEQVDEVVGAARTPQATANPRSCPQFGWWMMLPKAPSVGVPAEIRVDVSDADTPLEALSFEWVASTGTFSEPAATETTFTCEREGYQSIALIARDDTDCARQLDIQISCFPR